MYPAFATDATTEAQTLVRIAGFDYPQYFACIEEPHAICKYEVVITRSSRVGQLAEKIEVASAKDSPWHIAHLVRTNLRGWQIHWDVPMKLLWEDDF